MRPTKGRGAVSGQASGRFGLALREADGDWLDARALVDDGPPPLRTTVTEERARSILTFNRSPDVPFDRSVNAYRGCEQPRNGCVNPKHRSGSITLLCWLSAVALGSFSGLSKIVAQRTEKKLPENQAEANYAGYQRYSDGPRFDCIGGIYQPTDTQRDEWQNHPRYDLCAHLIDETKAIQWEGLPLQICAVSGEQIQHIGIIVARSVENGNRRANHANSRFIERVAACWVLS